MLKNINKMLFIPCITQKIFKIVFKLCCKPLTNIFAWYLGVKLENTYQNVGPFIPNSMLEMNVVTGFSLKLYEMIQETNNMVQKQYSISKSQ